MRATPWPAGCPGTITLRRGIELGHIFRLGTVYSEAMEARYAGADGEQAVPIMGCYGIGVERLMAAVIEANHDEAGIRWPASVAPFGVHLVVIGWDDPGLRAAAEAAERDLEAAGLSVLTDDRDERPGVKFNDADLLGMPVRCTVSPRNLKAGVVEIQGPRGGGGSHRARRRSRLRSHRRAARAGRAGLPRRLIHSATPSPPGLAILSPTRTRNCWRWARAHLLC